MNKVKYQVMDQVWDQVIEASLSSNLTEISRIYIHT
jgi:hypothetical protein